MNTKLLLLPALASILTLAGCATVEPGEVGIKSEFGKLKDEVYGPGLHGKNLFTENFETVNVQKQSVDSADATNSLTHNPSTKDQMPIDVQYTVIYQIPEAKVLHLKKTVKGKAFDSLVAPRVNEAMRAIISQYRSDEVTLRSQEIQHKVAALANELVGDDVTIFDVPITHIGLPQAITTAVIAKQNMEVQAKQKEYELEKERIEAEITVVKAKAEAEKIRLSAAAVKASPELVKLRLAEAEMVKAQKWNGVLPETMVGGNTLFNMK